MYRRTLDIGMTLGIRTAFDAPTGRPSLLIRELLMQRRLSPFVGLVICAALVMLAAGCRFAGDRPGTPHSIEWASMDGQPITLHTLENDSGLVVKVTSYGAAVTEVHVPDRDGVLADIVLGFDTAEAYRQDGNPYLGCIAGRCANRIALGLFTLDGRTYTLDTNNGPNHLHGGTRGFDKRNWVGVSMRTPDGPAVRLTRVSPDGEEGYPGALTTTVVYTLTHDNVLRTEITATTDAPTLCNLVQHNYWNLAGHDAGTIHDHRIQIEADYFTPVDPTLIPTGAIASVDNTPFDFRTPERIGARLADVGDDPAGYDHNLVIRDTGDEMRRMCRVSEPTSGRVMEVFANQPGLQFYSGNFLDGSLKGKNGAIYQQYAGFCLETQLFPDSIHRPDWPSPVLRPGETYRHVMENRFSIE